jgi:DNA-3-methyladenine glycosylase II
LRRHSGITAEARDVTFRVRWAGPLDIPASVEGFRRWGDDLLDRWDGTALVRTTRIGEQTVPFVCTVIGTVDKPALDVTVAHASHVPAVRRIVRRMFVQAPQALTTLMTADAAIAHLESRYRGVRPVLQTDPFTALIRSISAQQVNLRWAATTRRRLAAAFGTWHRLGAYEVYSLDVPRLARAAADEVRALQFTTRKSEYITALAAAVADGRLDLEQLGRLSDANVMARLTALRGIGRWTAEWFLARTLGRPCVAAGDLGVRKAIGAVYLAGRLPTEAEVRELTAHWQEAAGVAQQLVLHALGQGTPSD